MTCPLPGLTRVKHKEHVYRISLGLRRQRYPVRGAAKHARPGSHAMPKPTSMTPPAPPLPRLAACGVVNGLVGASLTAFIQLALTGALSTEGPLSFGAVAWFMYALDRLVPCAEDTERSTEHGHQRLLVAVLASALAAGLVLSPLGVGALLLWSAAGAAYFLRIGGAPRVKDLPWAKAPFVGLMMTGGAFLAAGAPPLDLRAAGLLLALWVVIQLNSTVYDIRDMVSDRAAGVPTLPALLPRPTFLLSQALLTALGLGAAVLAAPSAPGALACLVALLSLQLLTAILARPEDFDATWTLGVDGATTLFLIGGALAMST